MLKTSELLVIEGQELQLVCAGDVMGWLGSLPLSLMEDVRMGRPMVGATTAQAGGNVGAVDCASALESYVGGTGKCGAGADCGGSGCCGGGGDCAAN